MGEAITAVGETEGAVWVEVDAVEVGAGVVERAWRNPAFANRAIQQPLPLCMRDALYTRYECLHSMSQNIRRLGQVYLSQNRG